MVAAPASTHGAVFTDGTTSTINHHSSTVSMTSVVILKVLGFYEMSDDKGLSWNNLCKSYAYQFFPVNLLPVPSIFWIFIFGQNLHILCIDNYIYLQLIVKY